MGVKCVLCCPLNQSSGSRPIWPRYCGVYLIIVDVACFLFGEARTLSYQNACIHPGIQAEDVATVRMEMGGARPGRRAAYSERIEMNTEQYDSQQPG